MLEVQRSNMHSVKSNKHSGFISTLANIFMMNASDKIFILYEVNVFVLFQFNRTISESDQTILVAMQLSCYDIGPLRLSGSLYCYDSL